MLKTGVMSAAEPTYLRRLFDTLEVGVVIADDHAVYVDVNRAAATLFGRAVADLVGHHLSEFIPGARAEEVNVQWRAFLRDGSQTGVFSVQLPNGGSQSFRFQAQANFVPGLHCSLLTPFALPGTDTATGVLTVCAWTKRVHYAGAWITIEEYLHRAHNITVSHGICTDGFSGFYAAGESPEQPE